MILRTTRGIWDQGDHKLVGLTSKIWSGLVTAGQLYLCELRAEVRSFTLEAMDRSFGLDAEARSFALEGGDRCR